MVNSLSILNNDTDQKPGNLICAMRDLSELECREFRLAEGNPETTGFVVKTPNRVVAYQNRCPHTGTPLNWQENKFLDIFNTHIQCTLHGAIFQIGDGLCIRGPCIGRSLKRVNTVVENDQLYHYGPERISKAPYR